MECRSCYKSVLLLVVSTLNLVLAGEVRCFCNLPICVTSGYMCKSSKGGCFSDLFDFLDVYKARHGCVELLDKERQGQCQNEPGSGRGHPRSLLLCCRSDMCNHVDSPEIKIRVNDTFLGSIPNATETRVFTTVNYSSNEVWFKAATIAVPICGAMILFVLVALAVRILRRDGLDGGLTPKQGGHYAEMISPDNKKFPLLPRHQPDKNETNARLNSAASGNVRRDDVPAERPNNNEAYRDVAKCYDKRAMGFCANLGPPSRV